MTMRCWIRKLVVRPVAQPLRKRPRRARLAVEALEQRRVPSFTVTNLLDDGSVGSLRWAVGQANATRGNETIDFDPTVFATPQTITLTGTQLELTDTTGMETIVGPAVDVAVSGGGLSRVFQIDSGVSASISGLTISGGNAGSGDGGGIDNLGTATLTHCTVSGNSASGDYGGGGLANLGGALTLTDCTISGNSARSLGGGLLLVGTNTLTHCTVSGNSASGVYGGGGLACIGGSTTTLTDCTVSGNSATGTYGSGGGLACIGDSTTTLTDCTVSVNSVTGTHGSGGGLFDYNGTLTLTDCTVSGNSAYDGGGLFSSFGQTLTDCTVSGNSARGHGGGLFTAPYIAADLLHNTLIAGNVSGPTGMTRDDVNGRLDPASDYNLIGDGSGMTGISNGVHGNFVGSAAAPIDPRLGPLQDHGGPTPTMALLPGSPALDAGAPDQLGSPDQRGVVRTGGVNIGAYQASASAFVLTAPDTVTAGMPFDVTVTAVDSIGQLAVGYTGTVSFSTTDPDPDVVLPPDYPFTLADQGLHTFMAGFTLQTPGMWTVTATDTTGGFASSVPITVTAGGGCQSPNAPPPRHDFAVVDRFFAALPGDPGFLGLVGTASRGEDPSPALLWAARPVVGRHGFTVERGPFRHGSSRQSTQPCGRAGSGDRAGGGL